MSFKLSIFTTATRPIERGDTYKQSMKCYKELADEVIVTGRDWPQEFSWELIGQKFQEGYEKCSGDWAIHSDLDFIFHERDFPAVRKAMEDNPDAPALSFWKYQFILPDRYNLKSRLVIAVNKAKYGDRIKFNSGGDLCQPSLDGRELKSSDVPEARVPFYNYEKLIKTKEQVKDDVIRMDRAYHRHFKRWLYSDTGRENEAYNGWLDMAYGRFNKPQEHIKLKDHPKYIQKTISNLTPEQFGFNGFGGLEINDYLRGIIEC